MHASRKLVWSLLLFLLLGSVSCKHKKQRQVAKPNQTAPTLHEPLPDAIPIQHTETQPATTAATHPPPEVPKSKPRPRRIGNRKPPQSANNPSPAQTTPSTTTPGNTTTVAAAHPPANPAEAAPEPAIRADVSSPQATQTRDTATQVLDTTENEIRGLNVQGLSSDQDAMLSQIKAYIAQSRKAMTEGDYERALNLARKAQLLADALTKK